MMQLKRAHLKHIVMGVVGFMLVCLSPKEGYYCEAEPTKSLQLAEKGVHKLAKKGNGQR